MLRSKGRAFGGIAEELGLGRAGDANRAFNRALRRRPAEEQASLRAEENRRLDRLAETVRVDDSLSEPDAEKRLRTIERLRTRLMHD